MLCFGQKQGAFEDIRRKAGVRTRTRIPTAFQAIGRHGRTDRRLIFFGDNRVAIDMGDEHG